MDAINRSYECPGCCKINSTKVCPSCGYVIEAIDYFKGINEAVLNYRKAVRGETK